MDDFPAGQFTWSGCADGERILAPSAERLKRAVFQNRGDGLKRHRPAVEIALCDVAAEVGQSVSLVAGFDAFRGDAHADVSGQVDDQLHDLGMHIALAHTLDEVLIDLDQVDGVCGEIVERGVAGAEVVEGNLYAERADGMEERPRCARSL